MKNTKDLIFSKEQHTAIIKINRPPNNFFDAELIKQIADLLENIDLDNSLRSVILCSEGKNFCAGADFSKSSFKENSNTYSKLYDQAIRLFKTKKPIISIIQGAAVGGGLGLALATDFRIGSKVRVDLNNVNDRIPSNLKGLLKDDPRGTLVDYKMTDGGGIGVVLELNDGSTSWFFADEIIRA